MVARNSKDRCSLRVRVNLSCVVSDCQSTFCGFMQQYRDRHHLHMITRRLFLQKFPMHVVTIWPPTLLTKEQAPKRLEKM
jgi:hypothetical protein